MRTIYLQGSLSINGRGALRGRHLVDRLREVSEALLLGHMVMSESRAAKVDPYLRPDVISEVEMLELDPDVIFMEQGFFSGRGVWRIEEDLAKEFIKAGGTLIVADVDLNTLRDQRLEYEEVVDFLGASAAYCDREPVAGYDEVNFWRGTKQILCRPRDMVISDWLRPVYEDIPEIICGLPVRLASWGDILASGNRNSTWSDATDGIPGPDNLPFASVHKYGDGFVSLICALVTSDAWLEGCPHNTAWLVSLAKFLSDASHGEGRRARSAVKSKVSVFLSHAHDDKPTVAGIHRLLTREYAIQAWLDEQRILPGDHLPQYIENAIRMSSFFVLFWSAAAAESEWVRRELETALAQSDLVLLIVRLDEKAVPDRLADLLRIECIEKREDEIAGLITKTIQNWQRRARIDEARRRANTESRGSEKKNEAASRMHPPGTSFTRFEDGSQMDRPKPFTVTGSFQQPKCILTIRSTYRIDVLSFFDGGTLASGSGEFDSRDVACAKEMGLIEDFQQVSCQTGMDGHLDDHVPTRRHLLYGYHDMNIFDRTAGEVIATFECDSGANVMSAAWSPGGDRIIVGSTNYLTVADNCGRIIASRNLFAPNRRSYFPKSVAWQPSTNPIYATENRVCIADPDGRTIHELSDMKSMVMAVAVSPCCRFLAAVAMNGQVAIWSESGELLVSLKGFASDGWHASRCLVFSPDSRLLCQAGCVKSEGFFFFDMVSGKTSRVLHPDTSLFAFHPKQTKILVSAAKNQISFWQTNYH